MSLKMLTNVQKTNPASIKSKMFLIGNSDAIKSVLDNPYLPSVTYCFIISGLGYLATFNNTKTSENTEFDRIMLCQMQG